MTISTADHVQATARIRLQAPAKINLTLDVLGKREDGFHELCSLVVGVGLCDELSVSLLDGPGVELWCSESSLAGPGNLAWRAAELLASECGVDGGARLGLVKRVPVGSGMGGGSSDAAAALRLCNRLWGTGLSDAALAELGARVGSDVPVFFGLPAAVMCGRGERVAPVPLAWHGWVMLVFAGVEVPTAAVYAARTASDGAGLRTGQWEAAARARTAAELSGLLSNHLEPAIFRVAPRVKVVFDQLVQLGFGTVRVSGAGSALYVLFDEEEPARVAATRVMSCSPALHTLVVPAPVPVPCIVSEESVHGDF